MAVDRREVFKIIGAGLTAAELHAQHEHRTPTTPQGEYQPRVLNAKQYATLRRLLDILLPADELSPSASQAGAGMYIDTTLKHGDDSLRASWTLGLDELESADASTLTQLAENESSPKSSTERFFVQFKQAAINAYYLSDAGRKSLGYRGDIAIRDFPGCTHAEHKG